MRVTFLILPQDDAKLYLYRLQACAMNQQTRSIYLAELVLYAYGLLLPFAQGKSLKFQMLTNFHHQGVAVDAVMLKLMMSILLRRYIQDAGRGNVRLLLLQQSDGQQAGYGSFAIALDEVGTELCKNNQRQVCGLHQSPGCHRNRN